MLHVANENARVRVRWWRGRLEVRPCNAGDFFLSSGAENRERDDLLHGV
jgi:hypothetical protein